MSDDASQTIQVNFARPVPLFPLDGVVLLPHALLRLYIFEPRYRQMVQHALDGPGLIAMAIFEGDAWKQQYHAAPPIRRCVCLGHIAHHEKEPGGNYKLILQGVCRARVRDEQKADDERLYRQALLEPLDSPEPAEDDLLMLREGVLSEMRAAPMPELAAVRSVLRELDLREVPTPALMEVVTLSVLNDKALQYKLLCEGDLHKRAQIIERELRRLRGSLQFAARQFDENAPSGVTWN